MLDKMEQLLQNIPSVRWFIATTIKVQQNVEAVYTHWGMIDSTN